MTFSDAASIGRTVADREYPVEFVAEMKAAATDTKAKRKRRAADTSAEAFDRIVEAERKARTAVGEARRKLEAAEAAAVLAAEAMWKAVDSVARSKVDSEARRMARNVWAWWNANGPGGDDRRPWPDRFPG